MWRSNAAEEGGTDSPLVGNVAKPWNASPPSHHRRILAQAPPTAFGLDGEPVIRADIVGLKTSATRFCIGIDEHCTKGGMTLQEVP
jgi:hypothetical protein